ncbi:antibiotic biosynthesis monooxygenase family protein [Mangrovicella endophytica]|uniref:antibiotic biosynthesis monooxygenase family protein n=1 Tax=Mangrovicella endophytica TaxID=2066697 RepID=UPI000C9E5C36|nr:antibiotic biosynthesis monooxygenase [Mangrovicella endophytica]
MFIAMNRFKVLPGSEAEFEAVWQNRDSQLHTVPGFVEFNLLKGPERDGYTLYSSHTLFESREHFEAWTKSEAFRQAHRGAGERKPLTAGHPEFEGFEVLQTIGMSAAA